MSNNSLTEYLATGGLATDLFLALLEVDDLLDIGILLAHLLRHEVQVGVALSQLED